MMKSIYSLKVMFLMVAVVFFSGALNAATASKPKEIVVVGSKVKKSEEDKDKNKKLKQKKSEQRSFNPPKLDDRIYKDLPKEKDSDDKKSVKIQKKQVILKNKSTVKSKSSDKDMRVKP